MTTHRRARPLAGAIAAAMALTLSACGGASSGSSAHGLDKLSATQLLAKAKTRLDTAHDFSVDATTTEGSNAGTIKLAFSGDDATGTADINGGTLTLLTVGGTTWLKGDDAFWQSDSGGNGASVVKIIDGRWGTVTDPSSHFQAYLQFASRKPFTQQAVTPKGTPHLGKPTTIDGVACLTVKDDEDTFYLAKDDARPIAVTSTTTRDVGAHFTYKKVTVPAAPAADDVYDLSSFG